MKLQEKLKLSRLSMLFAVSVKNPQCDCLFFYFISVWSNIVIVLEKIIIFFSQMSEHRKNDILRVIN